MQCQATVAAGPAGNFNHPGGYQCTREAKYTDGANFYCTQHAKEPPTPTRKASGKIRAGLRLIDAAKGGA